MMFSLQFGRMKNEPAKIFRAENFTRGELGFEEIFLSAGRSFSFFKNIPSRFAVDCSTKIIIIIMKIIGTTASVWRWSPIQVLTPPDRACLSPVAVLMLKSFCQKKHHPPLPPIFYSQCFPFTLASQFNTATIVFLVNIFFFSLCYYAHAHTCLGAHRWHFNNL